MPRDTLTVTDNRTGKQYDIPIELNSIRATDLEKIRVAPDQPGLVSYDPPLLNTPACKSEISYIDAQRGTLRYRASPLPAPPAPRTPLDPAHPIPNPPLPTTPPPPP